MSEHLARVKHDPESHAVDAECHDDCEVTVVCPGVTDACRTWWECTTCRKSREGLDRVALDEFDDRLSEDQEAHGKDHQWIDGRWMTPSNDCLASTLDTDADELTYTLPDGDTPVEIECEEGFVYVVALTTPDPSPASGGSE